MSRIGGIGFFLMFVGGEVGIRLLDGVRGLNILGRGGARLCMRSWSLRWRLEFLGEFLGDLLIKGVYGLKTRVRRLGTQGFHYTHAFSCGVQHSVSAERIEL